MSTKEKDVVSNPIDINSSRVDSITDGKSKFFEKTKNTVRNILVSTWIVAQAWLWMWVETVTSTAVPAAVETAVASATWNLAINTISLWTAATLLAACNPKEDLIAPTIDVRKLNVEIKWETEVSVRWNSLYIWNEEVATWKDNESNSCDVSMTFNGKVITSWYDITEWWTLTLFVTDGSWNISKKINIKVSMANELLENEAPEIEVKQEEVNVKWWKEINVSWKDITLWWEVVATWKDDLTEKCDVKFKVNGREVKAWSKINEEWTLVIEVIDEQWKSSKVEIKLIITNEAPEIEVKQEEVNVKWWKELNVSWKDITLWWEVVATWKDDLTEKCEVKFKVNGREVKAWDKVNEESQNGAEKTT